ncbi:hypothetical protein STENO_002148 [Stenotrophomonas maltophilia]
MHSAAQHERGCSAGLRPAPATSWSNSNRNSRSNSRSRFPVGSRGGSGCGGRRKPVPGGLAAASMPRTPPQPDPPRLRQISAICGSTPCVNESLSDNEINRGQIRFPTENGSDPMPLPHAVPTTHSTVTGTLSKVGRCRIAGCPRHGCRGQAPMDGFTASPQSDTAPPNHSQPRAALALALALALAVAGQRPALPRVQGAALPPPPSPAHENDFTDFSKPSSLRHASTILRSSMRLRATRAKNRPPIA